MRFFIGDVRDKDRLYRALDGIDYVVQDYDLGVLIVAKAMAMTVVDLLSRGGIKGTKILADYKAPMTKSAYLSLLRGMVTEETYAD